MQISPVPLALGCSILCDMGKMDGIGPLFIAAYIWTWRNFSGARAFGRMGILPRRGQVNEEVVKKYIRQQLCRPLPGYATRFETPAFRPGRVSLPNSF